MKRLACVFVAVAWLGALGCGDDDDEVAGDAGLGAKADGSAGGTAGASAGAGGSAAGAAGTTAGAGGSAAGAAGTTAGAGGSGGTAAGRDGGATDGGADAASTATDGASTTTTMMSITSAGGTLTAGGATLTIPAGALAATTTITITPSTPADSLPDRASIVGMVYDLGPNGTKFSRPVALTLPLAMGAPAGKGAVISWLDAKSNTWMDLPTTIDGNSVTGHTTHFTLFAVRIVTGVGSCKFASCAGSLVGAWDLTELCIGKENKDVNDICGKEDTASWVTATGGTATFTVGEDSKYVLTQKLAVRAFYSGACMTKVNLTACTNVEAALVQYLKAISPVCTGSAAAGCDCTFTYPAEDKGTVAAGNALVRDTEPAGEKQTAEACAKGANVQIRVTTTKTTTGNPDPVITGSVYVGKKK